MTVRTRGALLPLLLLAAVLGAGSPGHAQGRTLIGVGSHGLDARSVRYLKQLGVRHVRTTIYWAAWETDPAYRRDLREGLARAEAAGLEVLAVVHQQPKRFSFRNRRAAYQAYAEFMGTLAATFPQITSWQLWNEMDVESFTDLFGAPRRPMRERGRLYGEMLRLAHPAIKRANPRARVVTGGIASGIEDGFLDGLLESRAPLEVVAIHTYGFPVELAVKARGTEARAVLRRHGRGEVPLWVTEFGMEAAVVAPDWDHTPAGIDRYHLEGWRNPVLWNDETRTYDRMYGHVLFQGGDLSFDLVRRDGTLRPAARWLQSYLR